MYTILNSELFIYYINCFRSESYNNTNNASNKRREDRKSPGQPVRVFV